MTRDFWVETKKAADSSTGYRTVAHTKAQNVLPVVLRTFPRPPQSQLPSEYLYGISTCGIGALNGCEFGDRLNCAAANILDLVAGITFKAFGGHIVSAKRQPLADRLATGTAVERSETAKGRIPYSRF